MTVLLPNQQHDLFSRVLVAQAVHQRFRFVSSRQEIAV